MNSHWEKERIKKTRHTLFEIEKLKSQPFSPQKGQKCLNEKVIVAITDSKMRLGGPSPFLEVIFSSEKVWLLGLFLVSAFVTGFFSRPRSKYLNFTSEFVFISKFQSLQAY